ncbi:hypothetical protein CK203_095864 [Vitis vinifera]|uniref:Uncharacterized protein n=1 Tax=Vitis vinifera TaxID=29760 RepID=A0A438C7N1_VITVI|nr:hypothetical protein CK203_095864 [Vitis vinifera]
MGSKVGQLAVDLEIRMKCYGHLLATVLIAELERGQGYLHLGICILASLVVSPFAPKLEWLSVPSLVSSTDLKVMIGEADWWRALKWNKSEGLQTPNLDSILFQSKGTQI